MNPQEKPYGNKSDIFLRTAILKNREYKMDLRNDQNIPPSVKDLIVMCWNDTPAERPSFSTIHNLFENRFQAQYDEVS